AASRCIDRHPLRGQSAPVGSRRRGANRVLARTHHRWPCRQGRPGGPMEGDDRSMRERLLELKAWIAPYATELKLAASIVGVVVLAFVLRYTVNRVLRRFFMTVADRAPTVEERRRVSTVSKVLRHTVPSPILAEAPMVVRNQLGISIPSVHGAAGVAGT